MLKKILTTLLVALQLGATFVPAAVAHPAKTYTFATVDVLTSKVDASSTPLAQTNHDHYGSVHANRANEQMPCHDSKPTRKHGHHCENCTGCQSCSCAAPASAVDTAFLFQKLITAQVSQTDLVAQLPQHITSAIYHPPKS